MAPPRADGAAGVCNLCSLAAAPDRSPWLRNGCVVLARGRFVLDGRVCAAEEPDRAANNSVSYSYFQPGGASGCGDIKHYQSFSNTKSSKLTLSLTGSVVNTEPGIEAPLAGGSMVGVRTGSDPVSILLSDGSKLSWSPSNQKQLTRTSAAGTVLWGVPFPELLDISTADSLPDGTVRIGGPIASNSQVSEAAIIGLDAAGQPVWQVSVNAALIR